MIVRGLLATVATIAFAFLAQPQAAHAQSTKVYPYPDYPYDPGYPDYDEDEEDFISCSEGRLIVHRAGYRSVRPTRCYGEVYRYRGIRRGFEWRISVDAGSGAIIGRRRIQPIYTIQ
jgi:hypothetical protein